MKKNDIINTKNLRRSSERRRPASSRENQPATGRHLRSVLLASKRRPRRPAPTGESLSLFSSAPVRTTTTNRSSICSDRRTANSGEGKVITGEPHRRRQQQQKF
ncbi:hypothetical protein H5410_014120 [Solanum commersonii]|uniref:Uncharacterized protein n=1 Tax=Solanum commersonii TaxID=4109 RepID=A0A9J5ZQ41_SOLCO|nr:hypothetical protein H5410_014120 [Solanum commersonii]